MKWVILLFSKSIIRVTKRKRYRCVQQSILGKNSQRIVSDTNELFSLFRYTVNIAQGAYVCEERLQLIGEITIGKRFEQNEEEKEQFFLGSKTIIHPGVSIIAEAGPIFIGDGNLIEEQCVIANR